MKPLKLLIFSIPFFTVGVALLFGLPESFAVSSIGKGLVGIGGGGLVGGALWGKKGFTYGYMIFGLALAIDGAFDAYPGKGGLREALLGAAIGFCSGLFVWLMMVLIARTLPKDDSPRS